MRNQTHLFRILLLASVLPAFGTNVDYRLKGWYYYNVLGHISLGYPNICTAHLPSFAIGFAPPFGLGVGLSAVDLALPLGLESLHRNIDSLRVSGFLPVSAYLVPYIGFNREGVPEKFLYCRYTQNQWITLLKLGDKAPSGATYHKFGVGMSWTKKMSFQSLTLSSALGLEAGYHHYISNPHGSGGGYPYIEAGFDLAGGWGGLGVLKIEQPEVELIASFKDADGNDILSGNENGALQITVQNKGGGKALDVRFQLSVREYEYRSRLRYNEWHNVGNIQPYGERTITVPFTATGELPKGQFTIDVIAHYGTEQRSKEACRQYETVRTAPSTGIVKVSFIGLTPAEMPSWIAPTAGEYADYQVEYSKGKVMILDLNTGETQTADAPSQDEALTFVQDFFQSWDRENPVVTLSSAGGTVAADTIKLGVRLEDDHKLGSMIVVLNGKLFVSESFAEQLETERTIAIPLRMGTNTIRVNLTDWVGNSSSEEVTFTRIRGQGGTFDAGRLREREPPPELTFNLSTLDGNHDIIGGTEEGIKVTVTNNGKGIARWVRVIIDGDELLTSIGMWGKQRNLGDIKPGETKTAVFSILMPSDLPNRQAKVVVSVKEGRMYSPTETRPVSFTLSPAGTQVFENPDDLVPARTFSRNNGYALIVGISNYPEAPLKYARNDARVFTQYANRVLGITQIETLFDAQATGKRIEGKLKDWLRQKQGFKVIFFAGHGTVNPNDPSDSVPYLVPHDGDVTSKSTLLSTKDMEELCSAAPEKDTLLMVYDACLAGLAARPIVARLQPVSDKGIVLAAAGKAPAKEYDKAQHGYFTYHILLGLTGKADSDRDGWITTTELHNYVKDRVADATNNVQIPVLRPEREIRIGRYR